MKISQKILLIFVVLAVAPALIVGVFAINATQDASNEINTISAKQINSQSEESMQIQAELLAKQINNQLSSYINDINTIVRHPQIPALVREVASNGSVTSKDTDEGKALGLKQGHFYPSNKDGSWTSLQNYFIDLGNERANDIDLIRIFHKSGYILNGVSYDSDKKTFVEDFDDYKGDKSWFAITMNPNLTDPGEDYISPISIARKTNTPAIRYMTPIEVDGVREAMMIINFKATAITSPIQDYTYGKGGFAMLIDANYENAEGVIANFPIVISRHTDDGALYQVDEKTAAPLDPNLFIGDSGLTDFTENGVKYRTAYHKVSWQGEPRFVTVNVPIDQINEVTEQTSSNIQDLIATTKSNLIVILLIATLIAVTFGFMFSRSITKPIKELVAAGNKIAEGDLTVEIPEVKTKDEIRDIGDTISTLVGAIKYLKKDK